MHSLSGERGCVTGHKVVHTIAYISNTIFDRLCVISVQSVWREGLLNCVFRALIAMFTSNIQCEKCVITVERGIR